jgi:phenylacetate-CoA ligase
MKQVNDLINKLKKRKIKKGILETIAGAYPFSGLYKLGEFCQQYIEPLKLDYRRYYDYKKFYKESEKWDKKKIKNYQNNKLRSLIRYAYHNVPYYNCLLHKLNLKPKDFQNTDDLKKLPVLTREDVKANYYKLIANNFKQAQLLKRAYLSYTSGSSGTPMYVIRDKFTECKERVALEWALSLSGVCPWQKHICLRYKPFAHGKISNNKLFEPYWMRMILSTKENSPGQIQDDLESIKAFKPVYCIGSPAKMYLLSLHAKNNIKNKISFKVFISKYENIYEHQKQSIYQAFGAQTFRYYSSEEFLLIAADCPQQSMHLDIRKGIMEIIQRPGDEENVGRIIYTGFNNRIMPLIRYDTGDTGKMTPGECKCASNFPVLTALNGRGAEVISFNNNRISSLTIGTALETEIEKIAVKECQFVQQSECKLQVNLVAERWHEKSHQQRFRKVITDLIGEGIELDFNYSDRIDRTESGKFHLIKNQNVNI